MTDFILIHGAMHGGWCWERIVPLLEAQGHRAFAPDLPAMGADKTPASEVSLERYGRFVANILQGLPDRAILVGHSLGGMTISQAAEDAPDRIAALVYVAALLPRDGLSAIDITRGGNLAGAEDQVRMTPSADRLTATIAPEDAARHFYGETPAEWTERALSLLTPQPLNVLMSPARLSAERFGRVPRAYVECLRDGILRIDLQRSMQAASPCAKVLTIDTDHSPFYSTPEILAEHLLTVAAAF